MDLRRDVTVRPRAKQEDSTLIQVTISVCVCTHTQHSALALQWHFDHHDGEQHKSHSSLSLVQSRFVELSFPKSHLLLEGPSEGWLLDYHLG